MPGAAVANTVLYPILLISKRVPVGTSKVNRPSRSVTVPMAVPSTRTAEPMTGSPSWSITMPYTDPPPEKTVLGRSAVMKPAFDWNQAV